MTRFAPAAIWGLSQITARDQTRFFERIDRLMPARHRAYGMRLLASVVPSQRWGIGQVAPRGWQLYFKGGWGLGTGRVDHQVALLRRGDEGGRRRRRPDGWGRLARGRQGHPAGTRGPAAQKPRGGAVAPPR